MTEIMMVCTIERALVILVVVSCRCVGLGLETLVLGFAVAELGLRYTLDLELKYLRVVDTGVL